jgi:hypothetical protein
MTPNTGFAQTSGITLHWTAPGDDGVLGRATRYELRWSESPITPARYLYATPVPGVPTPAQPGTLQTFTVAGLDPRQSYYFVIRTQDDAGNWSPLSNMAAHIGISTGVDDVAGVLAFGSPAPNPARSSTRFAMTLPSAMDVRVEVFDLAGRRVRVLAEGSRGAGSSDLVWDLRDDHGRMLHAGMYLVRAQTGATTWMRRVSVVR